MHFGSQIYTRSIVTPDMFHLSKKNSSKRSPCPHTVCWLRAEDHCNQDPESLVSTNMCCTLSQSYRMFLAHIFRSLRLVTCQQKPPQQEPCGFALWHVLKTSEHEPSWQSTITSFCHRPSIFSWIVTLAPSEDSHRSTKASISHQNHRPINSGNAWNISSRY